MTASSRTASILVGALLTLGMLALFAWGGVAWCLLSTGQTCIVNVSVNREPVDPATGLQTAEQESRPPAEQPKRGARPVASVSNGLANPRYVAIVIGNSDYASPNALPNPRNDATDMAAALEKLGYTIVRDDTSGAAAWLDLAYPRLDSRSGASRAVEAQRGFQVVEATDRALFAFSAGPNQRASDSEPGEGNSPYTRELVRAMQEPDVKIEDVFKAVRQGFIDRGVGQKPEFRDNLGRPNLAFRPPDPPRKAGDKFRDCSECPLMVVVPKGKFLMGAPKTEAGSNDSERPQHWVNISRDFAVSAHEVTFKEYDACVAA